MENAIKLKDLNALLEAARQLDSSMISKYVREGRLKPWYIPGSSNRRFKLADVWALPAQGQHSTAGADDSVAVRHEIGG